MLWFVVNRFRSNRSYLHINRRDYHSNRWHYLNSNRWDHYRFCRVFLLVVVLFLFTARNLLLCGFGCVAKLLSCHKLLLERESLFKQLLGISDQ